MDVGKLPNHVNIVLYVRLFFLACVFSIFFCFSQVGNSVNSLHLVLCRINEHGLPLPFTFIAFGYSFTWTQWHRRVQDPGVHVKLLIIPPKKKKNPKAWWYSPNWLVVAILLYQIFLKKSETKKEFSKATHWIRIAITYIFRWHTEIYTVHKH